MAQKLTVHGTQGDQEHAVQDGTPTPDAAVEKAGNTVDRLLQSFLAPEQIEQIKERKTVAITGEDGTMYSARVQDVMGTSNTITSQQLLIWKATNKQQVNSETVTPTIGTQWRIDNGKITDIRYAYYQQEKLTNKGQKMLCTTKPNGLIYLRQEDNTLKHYQAFPRLPQSQPLVEIPSVEYFNNKNILPVQWLHNVSDSLVQTLIQQLEAQDVTTVLEYSPEDST